MRRGTIWIVAALGSASMISAVCAARQATPPVTAAGAALTTAWRKEIPVAGQPLVVASAKAIFVSSAESGLTAYSTDDGRELWTSQITADLAPVLAGSLVGAVSGGALRFVEQESGRAAWQAELGTAGPVTSVQATTELVLVSTGPELRSWRPNGSSAWRQTLSGVPSTRIVETGRMLVVGLPTPELVALDPASGALTKRVPLTSAPTSLAANGGEVFVSVKDRLLAYDAAKSFDRSWRRRMIDPVGNPFADEKSVYVVLVDNTLQAYSRDGGSQRWSFPLAWRPVGEPALSTEHVLIALGTGEVALAALANGRAPAAGERSDPALTRLNAATGSPDGRTLYTIVTAANQVRTLSAWRVGKPAS